MRYIQIFDVLTDDAVFSYGAGQLHMSGGNIAGGMELHDDSVMTFSGGINHGGVFTSEQSRMTISGGTTEWGVQSDGNSVVTISGGTLKGHNNSSRPKILAQDTAQILLLGDQFNYPMGDITDLSGTVTGVLRDGSPFELDFERDSAARITLVVPEPGTAVGLALGGVVLLTRRRRAGCGWGRGTQGQASSAGKDGLSNRSGSGMNRSVLAGLVSVVVLATAMETQAGLIEPVSVRVFAALDGGPVDESTVTGEAGTFSALVSDIREREDYFGPGDTGTVLAQIDVSMAANQIDLLGFTMDETNLNPDDDLARFEADIVFDVTADVPATFNWSFEYASVSLVDEQGQVLVGEVHYGSGTQSYTPLSKGRYTISIHGSIGRSGGNNIDSKVDLSFTAIPEPSGGLVVAGLAMIHALARGYARYGGR